MTEKRTFRAIALEIKWDWNKPYFGAVPYINAMLELDTTDPKAPYYFEDADMQVRGFLANAATWRGDVAKRIKKELKEMIGYGK